jgi:hypothetical protein
MQAGYEAVGRLSRLEAVISLRPGLQIADPAWRIITCRPPGGATNTRVPSAVSQN